MEYEQRTEEIEEIKKEPPMCIGGKKMKKTHENENTVIVRCRGEKVNDFIRSKKAMEK